MPQPQAKPAQPRSQLGRGERFAGRFDILDLAGIGAESVVYKVRDLETGAILALKVYDDQYGKDPKRREAFLREVELGGKIQHRNVVRILGAGETAGHSFILMEFLSGRTLAETLQISRRLGADEFIPIYLQIAAALDCLHSHGIVHRDIKPGNLMFTADGTLKLMDFGIARRYGDAITVGVARGTVDYAAPEQLLGKEPTAASDLFSLGAVSVELLTGQKPFRGQSQMERSTKAPPSLANLVPGLPADIAAAIEQCLQPDPSMRPTSASALMRLAAATVQAASVQAASGPAASPQAGAVHPGAAPGLALEAGMAHPPVLPPQRKAPAPPPAPARTLSLLLGDEPRPPMEVLPVLASLLSLLRRIADAGDAHDPVTPETVRLRPDGSVDMTRRPNPEDRDTWVISTPRFSAPELLRGETKLGSQGRTAAVLYSAGIIFYEILLGRTLFNREFRAVLRKNSDLAWMEWQVDESLHPRPLRELVPDFSPEVSGLLERFLQKDPAKRPVSYREAERAVHRLMQQSAPTEEIAMQPAPETFIERPTEARSGPSTELTLLIGLAIALGLVIAGVVAAWSFGLIGPGR